MLQDLTLKISGDSTRWTPEFVAALTGLGAVILVPLSTVLASWLQGRAQYRTFVAGHRQEWINKLRDHIAELMTAISGYSLLKQPHDDSHAPTAAEKAENAKWLNDQYERASRIGVLRRTIDFMLNPNEPEHQELSEHIRAMSYSAISTPDKAKLKVARKGVTNTTQLVLKHEWERVKLGERGYKKLKGRSRKERENVPDSEPAQ